MSSGSITLPIVGGGGGGGGNIVSINGDTSPAQFINGSGAITVSSSGGITTVGTDGGANTFAGFDGSGNLESIPGWQISQPWSGANVNLNYQPNNLGNFEGIENFQSNVDPLQNSPNDASIAINVGLVLDPNSTGFTLGTAGTGAYLENLNFTHHGKSNTGGLGVINSYSDLGNGTDPIDIKGFIGYSVFGDFNSGLNFSQGLQGFIFQPNLHAGCTISSGAFCQIYSDALSATTQTFNGYYSFNSNPNLGGMLADSGYSSFQANPTIGTLNGNASANMFFVGGIFTGSLGDGTGGGYTGVDINPNITTLDVNSTGINIGPNITAGTANWTAININDNGFTTSGQIQGLVINGPETSTAISSQGHHSLQSTFTLIDGLGQQYGNVIGGTIVMPDSTAITGTDTIANNFSFNVDTGNSGSTWTAASIVGMSCVGFVGEIIGAGTLNGPINFCLGGFAQAHTGTISAIRNFAALAIPEAAGTVGEHILYYADMPFGLLPGSSCWGLRVDDSADAGIENFVKRLAVNTTSQKVTNPSVAVEIGGTTSALYLGGLTTTEKNALTPLNGMLVYDTTLNKFQGYENGAWSNLI